MTAGKLSVDQEVRVFSDRKYTRAPGGGWRGTVTRVGRTLCDVEFERWPGRAEAEKFFMATGLAQYNSGGYYFLTIEQVRERDRRLSAINVLNQYGFLVSPDASVTADQIEAMAAILRPADAEPPPARHPRVVWLNAINSERVARCFAGPEAAYDAATAEQPYNNTRVQPGRCDGGVGCTLAAAAETRS